MAVNGAAGTIAMLTIASFVSTLSGVNSLSSLSNPGTMRGSRGDGGGMRSESRAVVEEDIDGSCCKYSKTTIWYTLSPTVRGKIMKPTLFRREIFKFCR